MMTPKQLREENAELRDIIVRGVMGTSDQLKVATEAKVMAEYRRRQTECREIRLFGCGQTVVVVEVLNVWSTSTAL